MSLQCVSLLVCLSHAFHKYSIDFHNIFRGGTRNSRWKFGEKFFTSSFQDHHTNDIREVDFNVFFYLHASSSQGMVRVIGGICDCLSAL